MTQAERAYLYFVRSTGYIEDSVNIEFLRLDIFRYVYRVRNNFVSSISYTVELFA
jgi:hypothetical protein